jgi:hypothetical protein
LHNAASRPGGQLFGVAAISGHDVWAVGDNPRTSTTLVEHYNGSHWSIVSSPTLTGGSRLLSVAAGPADVWAAGDNNDPYNPKPLVEHYDGRAWSLVSVPCTSPDRSGLESVVAVSPTDIWATGAESGGGLTEHFDGQSWSEVSNGPDGHGLAAQGPGNIWSVGDSGDPYDPVPVINRYNGVDWSGVSSPYAYDDSLESVAIVSPTDVWAVGYFYNTLVEHYNGTRWKIVKSPEGGLLSVVALSAGYLWAVGSKSCCNGNSTRTAIERYDGRRWKLVKSPNSSRGSGELRGIGAISRRNLWAVGDSAAGATWKLRTLVEHYKGGAWHVVNSPNSTG